jgi:hypothetical protein
MKNKSKKHKTDYKESPFWSNHTEFDSSDTVGNALTALATRSSSDAIGRPLTSSYLGSVSTPTPIRFGCEYTFVMTKGITVECNDDESTINNRNFDYINAAYKYLKSIEEFKDTYLDGVDSLEVPSPIHSTMEEAETFYKKLKKITKERCLIARRVDKEKDGSLTYFGTGGGHIHLEIPPKWTDHRRAKLMLVLAATVSNRPWLNWVFNEFCDDTNAKSPLHEKRYCMLAKGTLKMKVHPGENLDLERFIRSLFCKNYSIRFSDTSGYYEKTTTVELRFFDAPRSWGMAKDHIDFAQALMRYCMNTVEESNTVQFVGKDLSYLKTYDREKVKKEFKEMVEYYGLDWKRYQKYMINYDDRKKYGVMV